MPSARPGAARGGSPDALLLAGQQDAVSVAFQVCAEPAGEEVVLTSTQDELYARIWASASACASDGMAPYPTKVLVSAAAAGPAASATPGTRAAVSAAPATALVTLPFMRPPELSWPTG
ncbi:hypothetical protein GCM10010429_44470 [Micromonospora olivasterospora]